MKKEYIVPSTEKMNCDGEEMMLDVSKTGNGSSIGQFRPDAKDRGGRIDFDDEDEEELW